MYKPRFQVLQIDSSTNKAALEKAMYEHILAQGELVGQYKKTAK